MATTTFVPGTPLCVTSPSTGLVLTITDAMPEHGLFGLHVGGPGRERAVVRVDHEPRALCRYIGEYVFDATNWVEVVLDGRVVLSMPPPRIRDVHVA